MKITRITDASACVCPCLQNRFRRGARSKPKPVAECLLCGGSGTTTVGVARRFAEAQNVETDELHD